MLGNQQPQTTPQQRRNKLGLIIFIVLFFLLTIHDEDDTKTSSSSSDINKNLPASILKQRLEHQLLNNYNLYPHNLTGYFTGNWSFGTNTSIASSTSSINTTNINTTNIGVVIGVPTSVTDSIEQDSTNVLDGFTQSKGVFLFRITKAATSIQTSSIIEIQGSLRIVDGTDLNDWTLKAWSATCRGLYFPGTGKLTMFTNSWGYNLYLREQHIPGRSGDIDIYNDTLIVLADQDTEEKDDADGDDSNNKNNNIGNVTTLPVSSSLSSSLSQQKKKKSKSSCIARVDMDVSISSHPEQHVTNAATTLSDATDLTNTNQVAAFTLSSTTSSALSPATPLPSLSYDGTITTPLNCHLDVSIRTHVSGAYINFNTLYDTGHIYGLLACINTGIQILTHLNLLKQSSRNSILTQSMSPISFLFISCIDAIECLLHFCIAILFDELFSWFIIIGILKFVLFSIMELKVSCFFFVCSEHSNTINMYQFISPNFLSFIVVLFFFLLPLVFRSFLIFSSHRTSQFLFKIFSSRNIMSTLVDRGRLNARFYCSLLFLTALLYRSFSILKIILFLLASGIVIPQLIDNAWQGK